MFKKFCTQRPGGAKSLEESEVFAVLYVILVMIVSATIWIFDVILFVYMGFTFWIVFLFLVVEMALRPSIAILASIPIRYISEDGTSNVYVEV